MVLRKLFTLDAKTNGKGPANFAWSPNGSMLAVVGANHHLTIVDRQGKTQHTAVLPAQSATIEMDWDRDSEVVAILQQGQASVSLFHVAQRKMEALEAGFKDLTCVRWSSHSGLLGIGNTKGNICIYNPANFKKVPISGLQSKRIIDMTWNRHDHLAVSSEDHTVTVIDAEGTKLDSLTVKGEAANMAWADRKLDNPNAKGDGTLSLVTSGKTLTFHQVKVKEQLVELAFNKSYGSIVRVEWFGDGYVLIGFSNGHVTIVSTHQKEIGGEISNMRSHRESLTDIAVNRTINKGASIGDNFVRVFELDDLKLTDARSEKFDFESEVGALRACGWSEDGQILTVSSNNGSVYSFLTRIPVIHDCWGSTVLYMQSLRELLIRDVIAETDVATIAVEIEPTFVAVSRSVAAIGMNNQVYFYSFAPGQTKQKAKKLYDRQYPTVVDSVKVSPSYAGLLMSGKATLHPHEEQHTRPQLTFPSGTTGGSITCHAMTESFYITGSSNGTISIFSLVDHTSICEFAHTTGIRYIAPNLQGTRLAWIDNSNRATVFNPATELPTQINQFAPSTEKLVWDPSDYSILVGVDPKHFTTYVYAANTRYGSSVHAVMRTRDGEKALTTTRPYSYLPVLTYRGVVICQMPSGGLVPLPLHSHEALNFTGSPKNRRGGEQMPDGTTPAFDANYQLNRLQEAVKVATLPDHVEIVAARALHLLDIDLAIRLYRQLGKPGIVQCLESIRHIHERNILLGYVSMIFKQYNDAQNYFQLSSNPVLALDMRRDLMHWDQALQLAQTLAPDQVPALSREYAQQLELRGEYAASLDMFAKGIIEVPAAREDSPTQQTARAAALAQNTGCEAGRARCLIRLGNVRDGVQIALQSGSAPLCVECAGVLEGLKQFEEAATLYERAGQYDRAAAIYIKDTKQLKPAQRLLPKLTSRNVLVMYAKAKESMEGAFADAMAAYEQAEDWDNVVRVKVEFLNDLHGAYIIVRKTRSTDAADLVAKVCKKKGEINAAVEFLLLAKKTSEAFELAKERNSMSAFETAVLSQATLKDGQAVNTTDRDLILRIADWHLEQSHNEMAGDLFHVGAAYSKALDCFLAVGSEEYIEKAIEVVGKANNGTLTSKLQSFLSGEIDGEPKDPNYIFKLHMALKSFEKAAKMAVIIAEKKQELGEYREARKMLIDTCFVLQERGLRFTADLLRAIMLLQSYLIVRHLSKTLGDPVTATRMLLRVARNIKKFPEHKAGILSSTCVQCSKTEFHASAYRIACELVQTPELRAAIPEKSKKKIEVLVRKRGAAEPVDPPEAVSQCPFCQNPVGETVLECTACKNRLPFCIVTGKHMVVEDWAECPHCQFPASFDAFLGLLRHEPQCPLCERDVDPMKLVKVTPDLKKYQE